MSVVPSTAVIFIATAIAEIAGCFAFCAWLRNGKSPLWLVPGIVSLVLFAYLLTLVPSEHVGVPMRPTAGIYIAASVIWLWLAENQRPDVWYITGSAVAIAGAAVILFSPHLKRKPSPTLAFATY